MSEGLGVIRGKHCRFNGLQSEISSLNSSGTLYPYSTGNEYGLLTRLWFPIFTSSTISRLDNLLINLQVVDLGISNRSLISVAKASPLVSARNFITSRSSRRRLACLLNKRSRSTVL